MGWVKLALLIISSLPTAIKSILELKDILLRRKEKKCVDDDVSSSSATPRTPLKESPPK